MAKVVGKLEVNAVFRQLYTALSWWWQVALPTAATADPIGARAEQLAANWLRQRGYTILAHSFRSATGEIDLIATYRQQVIFVEVKFRMSDVLGEPWEAVTPEKQYRLTRVAVEYLQRTRLRFPGGIRFDVIGITGPFEHPKIEHFPNAFPAAGAWSIYST